MDIVFLNSRWSDQCSYLWAGIDITCCCCSSFAFSYSYNGTLNFGVVGGVVAMGTA